MIDINQLEQLVMIAEKGTISHAAKELLISQPALSRSMQRLEQDLGVHLFDHYKNKVVLNKNGELAVKHAKKILSSVNIMINDVKEFDLSMSSITIASCTPAPIWDIEPMIKNLYNINCLSMVIDKDELRETLKKKKAQIILTPYEIIDKDIICIPYLDEDLCLSIPNHHSLSNKKEVKFSDLDGETMLLYNNIGFWHDIHKKTMPNTNFLVQGDRNTFMQIVKSSTFPTFTTNLSIKREGQPINRIVIPFNEDEAHVTFFLCINKKDKNRFKDLLDEVKTYFDY